jgi:hypothetical protein
MGKRRFGLRQGLVVSAASVVAALGAVAGSAQAAGIGIPLLSTGGSGSATPAGTITNFSFGQLQAQTIGATGCGTNNAGEPAIHVSRNNDVFLGSENGLGNGSQLWRGVGGLGGTTASACSLEYRGQPNTVNSLGVGASGGDIDVAIASALNSSGHYNLYVASLNLGSVNVATSTDNGQTFSQTPVQAGIPVDDREWIASFGASTALLSFHDIATGNIDILRSDNAGQTFTQTSTAIPSGDFKAGANELGNLVIDHRNLPAGAGNFFAYQSFVAPSSSSGSNNNEAYLAVSSDGGHTWTDNPIPCSTASSTTNLDHNFPNVSVAPNGNVWYSWSDDHNVFTAESTDHGSTWTCSGAVSTNTAQAIFPWLAATSAGVDLVYYGAPTATNQTWSVYFAQNTAGTPTGWGTPQSLVPVHSGAVCESGASCTSGRQLFDDFGIDTDSNGFAHIAYSHDSPDLNGAGTFTGYLVQTGGTVVGGPNN